MARAKSGRRKRSGERYPSGKLKPTFDKGSPGVIRRQALYAPITTPANDRQRDHERNRSGGRAVTETFDAVGRAMLAGLLDGAAYEPKVLCDAGRKYRQLAMRIFGVSLPKDSLAQFLPQAGSMTSGEQEKALEGMFESKRKRLAKEHYAVKLAMGALLFDPMDCDHGPAWLDRLIFAKRKGIEPLAHDARRIALAVRGLEAIA